MTYTVSTVARENDQIKTAEVGRYADKVKAMGVAKRLAKGAKDCTPYGPASLAYVGDQVTAVVAW